MKRIIISVYTFFTEIKNSIINDFLLKTIKPKVANSEDTISTINNRRCCLSRFGDGEFSLILGEDLKFQKFTSEIQNELKIILKTKSDNLLVCIPDIFGDLSHYTQAAALYWKKYLHKKRNKIYRIIILRNTYYDALLTRFYIDYNDKSNMYRKVEQLKSIWNNRKVLIVEGSKSRLGMGNDLFDNATLIERLVCPSINAYERIDEIQSAIESRPNIDLVLIALGPTATCLAYRLSKKNIQALDIGHIDIEYEWYLKGALLKEPVTNKYIGEIPEGDNVGGCTDSRYRNQIWRTIE